MTDPAPVVRLVAIRDAPLDVAEVLGAVGHDQAGGVVLFVGVVRDHDDGRAVSALEYTAHPTALDRLRDVVEKVAAEYGATAFAAVHRTGHLVVGDAAVVVAAAASHRPVAFDASRALIDRLKAEVPIWKHQLFADGTEQWVGTP